MNFIKKNIYVITGTCVLFLFFTYYAMQLNVSVINDETVTMANAAGLAGYDWSLMISSTGNFYYKYGQALLTLPLFAFLRDPDMIYRCAMILHGVFQLSIIPAVYLIAVRHLQMKNKKQAMLLAAIAALIPSIALYAFYFRGDVLLGVLPWHVLLCFLETVHCEANESIKRIIYTILAVFFCVLGYMAHTRGIVLLIALLLSAAICRIFFKFRSLHWPTLLVFAALFLYIDLKTSGVMKELLYNISGVSRNTVKNVGQLGKYFNLFSWTAIKSLLALILGWVFTLISTTDGLIVSGTIVSFTVLLKCFTKESGRLTKQEKCVMLFGMLAFIGFFAIGALFFKDIYTSISTGVTTRRTDRLIYDRYDICGMGIPIFFGLYAMVLRPAWMGWKSKLFSFLASVAVFALFCWKLMPWVLKYTGYCYNTMALSTFETIVHPLKILTGGYYTRTGLVGAGLLGLGSMAVLLIVSCIRRKWMPYVLLTLVLISEIALFHINFVKVRKSSNDVVEEITQDVTEFMWQFEDEVTDEFPHILKGGTSGVYIQYYQARLMSYRMFGVEDREQVNADDFFIMSRHGDIDFTFYEDDYYLFQDFDYEQAQYDIVYVKGEKLKDKMESLGYRMEKYVPEPGEKEAWWEEKLANAKN